MITELASFVLGGVTFTAGTLWVVRRKLTRLTDLAADVEVSRTGIDQTWGSIDALLADVRATVADVSRREAEVAWRQTQQAQVHIDLCRWRDQLVTAQHDLDSRDRALSAQPTAATGVLSVDALRAMSDDLLARAGVGDHTDHLAAIRATRPAHHVSPAMTATLHELVDRPSWAGISTELVDALMSATGTLPVLTDPDPAPAAPHAALPMHPLAGQMRDIVRAAIADARDARALAQAPGPRVLVGAR